jgi:hypothetical protein
MGDQTQSTTKENKEDLPFKANISERKEDPQMNDIPPLQARQKI